MFVVELLAIAHWFVAIGFILRVIYLRQPVGSSLAWIGFLLVFPFVGIFAYLLIGEQKMGRSRIKRSSEIKQKYQTEFLHDVDTGVYSRSNLNSYEQAVADVAAKGTGFYARQQNKMSLLRDETAFFDTLIKDIDASADLCFLEFYIIDPEGRVEDVLVALGKASKRGVNCHILADAVGSAGFFNSSWPKKLRKAGVKVHTSLPVGFLKMLVARSDLRNHRKICVFDGKIAYTGSHNLVDPKFFKVSKGVGAWVDVSVRCQGPVAKTLMAVLNSDIQMEYDEPQDLSKGSSDQASSLEEEFEHVDLDAQVIPSGPEQGDSILYASIVTAVYAAQEKIHITTPYFVPDDALLLALTSAAQRGIEIVLNLPEKIDSFLVHHTSRSYFRDLLEAGVKVALFRQDLLHAKIITIDENICLIGTANLDMRSFYLNLEVTLAVFTDDFCHAVLEVQEGYLANSVWVEKSSWMTRGKAISLFENTVRLSSPLL